MIEPAIIPARVALGDMLGPIVSTAAELDQAYAEQRRAEQRLKEACASGRLTLIVEDKRTGNRHAIPAAYFRERSNSTMSCGKEPGSQVSFELRVSFGSETFSVSHLDTGFYDTLCRYDGCPYGFIESEFRYWLKQSSPGEETTADQPGNAKTSTSKKSRGYHGDLATFMARREIASWREWTGNP